MANQKLVYVNDQEVWEFICSLNNFSAWVREQARREMQGGIDPAIVDYINQVLGGRGPEPEVIMAVDADKFDVNSSGFL